MDLGRSIEGSTYGSNKKEREKRQRGGRSDLEVIIRGCQPPRGIWYGISTWIGNRERERRPPIHSLCLKASPSFRISKFEFCIRRYQRSRGSRRRSGIEARRYRGRNVEESLVRPEAENTRLKLMLVELKQLELLTSGTSTGSAKVMSTHWRISQRGGFPGKKSRWLGENARCKGRHRGRPSR